MQEMVTKQKREGKSSTDPPFSIFAADNVNSPVPQSQSKPVYLHNIVCSRTDLTLLECSFTRYSGNINDVQDAVVICQQRKHYFVSIIDFTTLESKAYVAW